jgi:hypothetical protein
MSAELASAVQRHIDRVRQNPAAAVEPAELHELERHARQDMDGRRIATTAPVADYTRMSRVVLDPASDVEIVDDFPNLSEPMVIVGFAVDVLLLEAGGKAAAPTNAIDLRLSVGRDFKTDLNNAQNMGAVGAPLVRQTDFVSLSSVDATIANRLWDIKLDDAPFSLTFTYKWGVDQTTRTALNWGKTRVTVNWFVRLRNGPARRR